MTIHEALLAYIKAWPALTALVVARIYHQAWPKDREPTFPLITFFRVSGPRHHDISVAFPRYQFSCWAETGKEAQEVATVLREALQRFKGIMGGLEVIQIVFLNELDFLEPPVGLYQVQIDFKVIYREKE